MSSTEAIRSSYILGFLRTASGYSLAVYAIAWGVGFRSAAATAIFEPLRTGDRDRDFKIGGAYIYIQMYLNSEITNPTRDTNNEIPR